MQILFKDYKPGNTGHIPGCKTGTKFHGLKVLKSYSLFSYHCGILLEINIKRYLKITHIFPSAM